jgi:predicted metal-dependent peptidase
MLNLSEADRMIRAKINLQASHPFFAYILLNFDIRQGMDSKKVPTMGVDKYGHLFWNKEFVSTLSDVELEGVLCHEGMHIATQTFVRQGAKDMSLWNIATDLIINTLLIKEGLKIPENCILADRNDCWEFTGKNNKKFKIEKVSEKVAEEIYDVLSSNAEQVKAYLMTDGKGGYNGSFDQHLEGNAGEGDDEENSDTDADANANTEKWKKVVVEAATQAKMRGKSSGWMDRMVDGILNPQINWKAKLHQFITKDLPVDFTMRRPGRRFYSTGIYYPSVVRENLEIVIAIDTSGSIGDDEYKLFLSEVLGICKGFEQVQARILWWSTKVTNDVNVNKTDSDMLMNYKFGSTGGTTMSCVADYVKTENIMSRVFIYLTDGEIESAPKVPDGNILFVVSKQGNDNIVKKYGQVCKLK